MKKKIRDLTIQEALDIGVLQLELVASSYRIGYRYLIRGIIVKNETYNGLDEEVEL